MGSVKGVYLVAGGAVLLALLYVATKGAQATGEAIGSGAVDMATGVLSGVVQGAGTVVGIPPTDKTECQKAMAEGRTWDASFACPAGTFLKYLFN